MKFKKIPGIHRRHFVRIFITFGVLVIVSLLTRIRTSDSMAGKRLNCVIALNGFRSPKMSYSTGFNYEMLRRFCAEMKCEDDIIISGNAVRDIDSVMTDSISILVLPHHDTLMRSGKYICSTELDDGTVWLVHRGNPTLLRDINRWFSHFKAKREYKGVKERFAPSYEPHTRAASGRSFSNASPYDDLFRKYSAQIGWDWRMLAAVSWHESMFRIEARSPRGALGLMQMMPRTAARYDVESAIDPEENIEAGAKYLARLQRIFSRYASGEEIAKLTLAAYNAGEGRIIDCINYAGSIGAPNKSWEDIKSVIPQMREETILQSDTVKLGVFKGYETIRYVDRVLEHYKAFCIIAPGPSLPDPPAKQKDTVSEAAALSADTTSNLLREVEADLP